MKQREVPHQYGAPVVPVPDEGALGEAVVLPQCDHVRRDMVHTVLLARGGQLEVRRSGAST